ncbi:cysteine desulfurase [Patescibacteria group bacterium]|nr:cysteine desulfurase [Patescibacteria group bacterium]MDE1946368.1 cysteine desulfurase [Patescibacteria group bacterium]MDE2010820.1 cysteine desulfurase [Patescibacteria group bacterium]MDE2233120.1 cysteine desulfurase [Patescibacteria group bacterium]
MSKSGAYFDNASTTPVRPEVLRAMMPYFRERYGNPSNLYTYGREAKQAIFESTAKIAKALNCMPGEIVFTGSATEADNLALAGVARANRDKGNRIIISGVEHKGIVAVGEALKKDGFEVISIPVGKDGLVDLDILKKELNDKTILVSVTMADSETGTLQPIREISEIIGDLYGPTATSPSSARRSVSHSASSRSTLVAASTVEVAVGHSREYPLFHTDASQAAAYANIDVRKLGVDLMTISAHKLGGPKGVGALFVRKGVNINPIIHGGGQQGRLRSGTENVPAIVGFGVAMELNRKENKSESARIKKLRDRLEKGIFKTIPKVVLNGHSSKRLPNFCNISILDIEGEALLLHLDEHRIMINTGSACNSESLEPSYVLSALGNPYEFIHGSIRFTLGKTTAAKDVEYVLAHLPAIVEELRRISPLDLSLDQKSRMSDPKAFIGNQTPHFLRKKKSGTSH